MVARSYLVLQALTLLKLARVTRNPALAARAADKAARLQARLDETPPAAEASVAPADAKSTGAA